MLVAAEDQKTKVEDQRELYPSAYDSTFILKFQAEVENVVERSSTMRSQTASTHVSRANTWWSQPRQLAANRRCCKHSSWGL